jgi:V8-like Glu-specific endopeptidase
MRLMLARAATTAATLLVAATVVGQTRTLEQPVIYGEDDRFDVVAHPNADLRTIAAGSVGALIAKSSVTVNGNSVSFSANTLGASQQLCADERYVSQPAASFCSGTLIAPNLFLTAGHCVQPEPGACSGLFVVMNYQATAEGSASLVPITREDLFSCRRVVAHELNDSGNTSLDYAIIELDRVATPRFTPAVVRADAGAVPNGTPLALMGSPSGIPTKIDAGGRVIDARTSTTDYFVGTTDSFAGNSGSGVWDVDSLDLIGILVSGETDYTDDGSCNRVNYCAEGECRGENITYAFRAVAELCQSVADPTLCGSAGQCGDGFCSSDESASSCASDCAVACGDGICALSEWDSCPGDCEIIVPAEWTCDAGWYGSFDGCDCDCGVTDPDCSIDPTCVTGGDFSDLLCSATSEPAPASQIPGSALLALLAVLAIPLLGRFGVRRAAA